ncbi:allantoate amidohydrolase [Streptomyces decoyicus]
MTDQLKVDTERLWSALQELGSFGRYEAPEADLFGVSRPALSPADVAARRWIMARMEELGLTVQVDSVGNVFGRLEGSNPGRSPVVIGSHVDSVPQGGAFDGALGVLAALEVVRTLRSAEIVLHGPLIVAVFTEEEGSRFGVDMLGSAVAAGRIPLAEALALRDPDGVTLAEALRDTGFAGTGLVLDAPQAYLEVHIEQGPLLSSSDSDIGVPTGVQAISWHELTVVGRAAHAGATPPRLRVDAARAATRLADRMFEYASDHQDHGLTATVGRMLLEPGVINIIPGAARFSLDMRASDDEVLTAAEAHLSALVEKVHAERTGLVCESRRTVRTRPVPFAEPLRQIVAGWAERLGYRHQSLISGAGHDAQEMAALCPSAMIFVPGRHDGISHSPREFSEPDACAKAATLLLHVVRTLCEESP